MTRFGRTLVILWILCLESCHAPQTYLRVDAGSERGRVAVAWRRFDPPAGRPPVTLACMLHVGEPRFFAAVQERLDQADVVLMEGVIRSGSPTGDREVAVVEERAPDAAGFAPVRDQTSMGGRGRALAASFDLVYQPDALIPRAHFRAADIDAATFRDEFYRGNPSGFSVAALRKDLGYAMHRFRRAHPELSADEANRLVRSGPGRRLLAIELQALADVAPRPVALHRQREAIALRALDRVPADQSVVLCWGFGHGPALARGLQRRGYSPDAWQWREVFAYEPVSLPPAAARN